MVVEHEVGDGFSGELAAAFEDHVEVHHELTLGYAFSQHEEYHTHHVPHSLCYYWYIAFHLFSFVFPFFFSFFLKLLGIIREIERRRDGSKRRQGDGAYIVGKESRRRKMWR